MLSKLLCDLTMQLQHVDMLLLTAGEVKHGLTLAVSRSGLLCAPAL